MLCSVIAIKCKQISGETKEQVRLIDTETVQDKTTVNREIFMWKLFMC